MPAPVSRDEALPVSRHRDSRRSCKNPLECANRYSTNCFAIGARTDICGLSMPSLLGCTLKG